MNDHPAFWRHVCAAKAAELAGGHATARACLELAHRLTHDEDQRIQLERWSERLKPQEGFRLATEEEVCRPRKARSKTAKETP